MLRQFGILYRTRYTVCEVGMENEAWGDAGLIWEGEESWRVKSRLTERGVIGK